MVCVVWVLFVCFVLFPPPPPPQDFVARHMHTYISIKFARLQNWELVLQNEGHSLLPAQIRDGFCSLAGGMATSFTVFSF